MALLDFLKRKKEVEKSKPGARKAEAVLSAEKDAGKSEKTKSADREAVKMDSADGLLKEPHISEKSSILAEKNQYVFKVGPGASKIEIKKAIKAIYKTDVTGVKIIKIPPKKRRIGRTEGLKKGFVKAIVSIKKGQKIEIS